MADYIPSGEAERVAWLERFAGWFDLHGTDYGFAPSDVTRLVNGVRRLEVVARETGQTCIGEVTLA